MRPVFGVWSTALQPDARISYSYWLGLSICLAPHDVDRRVLGKMLLVGSLLLSAAVADDCGFFFAQAAPQEVKACIQDGQDFNSRKNGYTPLHWAASNNKEPAVISDLPAAGANISGRADNGATPSPILQTSMASDNYCLWKVCFVPFDTDETESRFFGFSEFLTALALMLIVLTVADFRYRFRLGTESFLTHAFAFWILAFIGFATLFTDAWHANGWLVLDIQYLTYSIWQLLLGTILLSTLLRLIYVALINPPIYSKHNAKYFWGALYHHILQGSPSNMVTIATELIRSAKSIIQHAPNKIGRFMAAEDVPQRKLTEVESIADNILFLIADKKFCRVIVQSSDVPPRNWNIISWNSVG